MTAPIPLLKGFAKVVATLKPDARKRLVVGDPDTRGLFVRVTPKGAKTYTVVARNPKGKQVWAALGGCNDLTLEEAREQARLAVTRIKAGLPAFPQPERVKAQSTFKEVSDRFLQMYVRKAGQKGERPLRSAQEVERIFSKYLIPRWENRAFTGIGRDDVTELLDDLSINNGPVMADAVLAQLSLPLISRTVPHWLIGRCIRAGRGSQGRDAGGRCCSVGTSWAAG